MDRLNFPLTGLSLRRSAAMAYGGQPTSVLSVVAFVCAVGVVLGYGPMLAVVGMVCAAMGMTRGEDLAGPAVLVAIVVLVLALVAPTGIALNLV